ncbi:hypothetical protein [Nocardia nepalensis]|uniref:hypothetical protein n=1 Tax=Nocardia nepalensis TaxID=3375448 RepID=UPI003B66D863
MRILAALNAIGYLPLTVYAGHVISLAVVEQSPDGNTGLFLWSVAIAAIGSLLWTRILGRGPLERLLTWVTRAAVPHPPTSPAARTDTSRTHARSLTPGPPSPRTSPRPVATPVHATPVH